MTVKTGSQASQQRRQVEETREQTNLDHRYGKIGIPCVAAAVRYAGDRKEPADAPAAPIDLRFMEAAS
jgi:hypothetical protein